MIPILPFKLPIFTLSSIYTYVCIYVCAYTRICTYIYLLQKAIFLSICLHFYCQVVNLGNLSMNLLRTWFA